MDTTALRDAYRTLLEAAATVAGSEAGPSPVPPPGEWSAEQILAHIALLNATTLTTVCSVATAAVTPYDNRTSADTWTLDRMIALSGGAAGLRDRIAAQADALCGLAGTLSAAELDTPVPTLLLSGGALMLDQPVPLGGLISGLAESELPGHTSQLLALLPEGAPSAS
jgi:hypothetical protein